MVFNLVISKQVLSQNLKSGHPKCAIRPAQMSNVQVSI